MDLFGSQRKVVMNVKIFVNLKLFERGFVYYVNSGLFAENFKLYMYGY